MRSWLGRLLRRAADWVDPPVTVAPSEAPPPQRDELDVHALSLVLRAEALQGVSGEFRRHWVYSRLVKRFPDRRRRDISLAIECAVRAKGDRP